MPRAGRYPSPVRNGLVLRQRGFTLIETLIVLIFVGALAAFSLPRIASLGVKINVRSARVAFGNLAVKARAAAGQRGCKATLNFTTGSAGVVWVTVCKIGQSGTDTLGRVEPLAARFGVSIGSTSSSLAYTPRGISVGYQSLTATFTSGSGGYTDSTVINQLGKVVR